MNEQNNRQPVLWGLLFLLTVLFLPSAWAYAYLDPTSGSFILQVIVAGVLGSLVTIRLFWKQIVARFKGTAAPTDEDEGAGE